MPVRAFHRRLGGLWIACLMATVLLCTGYDHLPAVAPEGSAVTEADISRDLTTLMQVSGVKNVGFDYWFKDERIGNIRVYVKFPATESAVKTAAAEATIRAWLYVDSRRLERPIRMMAGGAREVSWLFPINAPFFCVNVTRTEFDSLLQQSRAAHGGPDVQEMARHLNATTNCEIPRQ